jgi:hypothetical protein
MTAHDSFHGIGRLVCFPRALSWMHEVAADRARSSPIANSRRMARNIMIPRAIRAANSSFFSMQFGEVRG